MMYDILTAIKTHDAVFVSTDYDADGTLAAATAITVLKENNAKYHHFISTPQHPRGVNKNICDRMLECYKNNRYEKVLLITGDHGSSDYDNFNNLKEVMNVTIVVTDHHEVPNKIALENSTDYILNPKYSAECTPWLCGAAVMWQLLKPIAKDESTSAFAVIGNIVDMMSMADEDNRKFYHEHIHHVKKLPLVQRVLKEKYKKEAHDRFIAMNIGAILNSGYRANKPEVSVGALLGDKVGIVDALSLNVIRKQRVNELKAVVDKQVSSNKALLPEMMMVILPDPVDASYTGLVAGRINGELSVPTFVLSPAGKVFKGSFRTDQEIDALTIVKGTNTTIYAAGHQRAFGYALDKSPEAIDKLITAFKKYINDNNITYKDSVDAIEKHISEIDNVVKEINAGRPYGNMNKYPTFKFTGGEIKVKKKLRDKMYTFTYNGIECITFNNTVTDGMFDIIGEVEIDQDDIQIVVSKISK